MGNNLERLIKLAETEPQIKEMLIKELDRRGFDTLDTLKHQAQRLVERVREYCRSQKELWQLVPALALEADKNFKYPDDCAYKYKERHGIKFETGEVSYSDEEICRILLSNYASNHFEAKEVIRFFIRTIEINRRRDEVHGSPEAIEWIAQIAARRAKLREEYCLPLPELEQIKQLIGYESS